MVLLLDFDFRISYIFLHNLSFKAVSAHKIFAVLANAHHTHIILIAALVAFYFDISVFVDIPTFLNQNFFNGVNI